MKTVQLKFGVQLAMIVILLVMGLFFNVKRLNDYPITTHAWAQSDRYALAEGFQNNNFNFFKPEALTYNHQFPDDWQTAQSTTRTAVDFPIHDYLVAGLMKAFGTDNPWVFRSYILLYGLTGMFFLFKLSFLITGNVWRSAFITIFGASSPVFVFYQAGFLPSIPSLANAIIAIYFYLHYLKKGNTFSWNWMVFFFILAALSRTTFIIPFIAVLGVEFFRIIKGKTKLWNKIPSVLLGFGLVIGYLIYNGFLRNTYGSLFLYHLMPAKDFAQFVTILNEILDTTVWIYFSIYHYLVIGLALIVGIWMKFQLKTKHSNQNQNVLYFTLLYFLGALLFMVAMIGQMNVHDYYFLDTLFLPIMLALSLFLALLPLIKNELLKKVGYGAGAVVLFFFLLSAQNLMSERTELYVLDEMKASITDFENSDSWLDKQGVSRSDKILVIDSPTPNTPFILMKRKGFTTHRLSEKILRNSQNWDYDYLIFQNKYFYTKVLPIMPELLSKVKYVASNGKLTLCSRRKESKEQSVIDFMGLKTRLALIGERLDLSDTIHPNWTKLQVDSEIVNERFIYLNSKDEYGATFSKSNWAKLNQGPSTFYTSMKVKLQEKKETFVVVVMSDKGENVLYHSFPLHDNVAESEDWQSIEFYCPLPKLKNSENEFSVFLYNKGTEKVMVKDWKFRITDFD